MVRGYNIAIIVLAQYLAAIFIFSPEKSLGDVIFNLDLYFLILATICVIASGYIINNFYDSKKDLINKPIKSKIDSIVGQKIKLKNLFLSKFCRCSLWIPGVMASCLVFCYLYFSNLVVFP